ncbi:eef1akmt3, partial [Symbiodinium microadriaticum]
MVEARVSALRRLAAQDVVPAVQDSGVVYACSREVTLQQEVLGLEWLGIKRPFRLRLQAPPAGLPGTSEAAVVFGAQAAALPALWRGRSVVELGCGTGYVGLLLAQLGARVTLTDLPKFQEAAAASILATGPHIQPPGRASFCCLDWADLDANARALLKSAHVLVAAEPVTCQCSERDFLSLLEAVLGGGSLLCPRLEGFLVAHKHQQNFCIVATAAPSAESCKMQVLPSAPSPSNPQGSSLTPSSSAGRSVCRGDDESRTLDSNIPNGVAHMDGVKRTFWWPGGKEAPRCRAE